MLKGLINKKEDLRELYKEYQERTMNQYRTTGTNSIYTCPITSATTTNTTSSSSIILSYLEWLENYAIRNFKSQRKQHEALKEKIFELEKIKFYVFEAEAGNRIKITGVVFAKTFEEATTKAMKQTENSGTNRINNDSDNEQRQILKIYRLKLDKILTYMSY